MRTMTWMQCVNLSLRLSVFAPICLALLAGCSQKSDAVEGVDNGQPGTKGDKGDPGPQGPIGQPGPQGVPGDKGDKGDKGDTGLPGAKGDKGDTGLPGAKGDPGNPGMPGAAGPTGATGAIGPAGSAGAPGAPGMTGAKGDKGDKGNPGATGPAGTGGAVTEDVSSFAGYTSLTYTGRVTGGRVGMHAQCAATFTGSHLCHAAEYIQATSSEAPPAAGAWIDSSTTSGSALANNGSVKAGRYLGSPSCSSWNNTGGGDYGTTVNALGTIDLYGDCSTARPLACCSTPTKVRFAGFTTSTTTGAAGGRWKMHALCAAAFAGSHMCHGSEYIRTNSAASVPTGGAWIESSTISGTSPANSGVTDAARFIGGYSCSSWNNSGGGDYGTVLTEIGSVDINGDCGKARAVTCCL